MIESTQFNNKAFSFKMLGFLEKVFGGLVKSNT
jgi:hypothetical protein